jgi:hypothetical protein
VGKSPGIRIGPRISRNGAELGKGTTRRSKSQGALSNHGALANSEASDIQYPAEPARP